MDDVASSKMSNEEIARRYDGEVDRFADLTVGQTTTIDSPVNLSLVGRAAYQATPTAETLLDLGSGAGNASLAVLAHFGSLDCTLVDLSPRMLERGRSRLAAAAGDVVTVCSDFIAFFEANTASFDVVVAATSLHHLRSAAQWESVFSSVYECLNPGGGFWVTDLVRHENRAVQQMMWDAYDEFLVRTRGPAGRDQCFEEIEREDTPEPLTYQLDLMRAVGFREIDVLHKNSCFATFGGVK